MQKSFPITMKDVAELAKVSVSTVSHTINKTRFVSDVTRQRVLRAMAELGYHPNIIAQSLRRKRTNTVGLIISDITNPFFPEVVRGVEKQLIRAGYSIILANTDDDTEKERELVTLLYGKRVDGLIIVPSGRENKHIKFLVQQNVPVVLLDRKVEGLEVDTVLVDNCGGTKRLTEYLISLGHKRVGIIAGDINISTGRERLDGYVEALKKYSLFNDNLVKIGDFSQESGYSLTLELLSFSPPLQPLERYKKNGYGPHSVYIQYPDTYRTVLRKDFS